VHPYEVRSTVGTAWILRRSISNIKWFRSKGIGLDTDPDFLKLLSAPETVPLLLFPGPKTFNLSLASTEDWRCLVPKSQRPLFFVVDGTWTQAHAMLRKSTLLRNLPRVSFETNHPSEYGFKIQPHPDCLSSVEGVHRVIEILATRGWGELPARREHDQMIEIFRHMVKFQLEQERNPRTHFR
jgi:DTW domain-containing protein YfiP